MSIVFVRNHTSGSSSSTGTTVTATIAANVPIGNTLFAWVSFQNSTLTTPIVSSLSKMAGETNSWVKLASHNSNISSSGTGIRGEMWGIVTTVVWTTSRLVTTTLSLSRRYKTMLLNEFSGASLNIRGTSGATTGSSGAITVSTSGTALVAGDLVLGGYSDNYPSAGSADTDTLNGSWSTAVSVVTQIGCQRQHKIVTASGVQTYNTNANYYCGLVIVALIPAGSLGFIGWGVPV